MTKVLIVDDDPVYCQVLSKILSREGCDTRIADGAHGAIDVASQFRPQVIVADWMLRDFHDGLDLLYALRQAGIACPVILISGYPSDQLKTDADASGVFRFLPKPFEHQDLLSAIMDAAALQPLSPPTPPSPPLPPLGSSIPPAKLS